MLINVFAAAKVKFKPKMMKYAYRFCFVYRIPYLHACVWPSGSAFSPSVRASKYILHTVFCYISTIILLAVCIQDTFARARTRPLGQARARR